MSKRMNLSNTTDMKLEGEDEESRISSILKEVSNETVLENDKEEELVSEQQQRGWTGLFAYNRVASSGMSLNYIPPEEKPAQKKKVLTTWVPKPPKPTQVTADVQVIPEEQIQFEQ
ncbi:hypothetical protein HAX54_041359 [Datura stramonium]|uniref:Uncharacterized protein n=1 Tax=Datura stramonium TaxID=4076 RepID=A0ABS8VRV2_DATST|nr:hypothetical protein [Datura stramonium]